MTNRLESVTDRDLLPDHGIARIEFSDGGEDSQIAMGDDIGQMDRPVHFGRDYVALRTRLDAPTITLEVWDAEPPVSDVDGAATPWSNRREGLIHTRHRFGTLATIVGGRSGVIVTVASDRTAVRAYVSDQDRAEELESRYYGMSPANTSVRNLPPIPRDLEFWLVQFWPA